MAHLRRRISTLIEKIMKRSLVIIILSLILFCPKVRTEEYQTPKRVVISGKILNLEKDKENVEVYINFIGVSRKTLFAKVDAYGVFKTSFDAYIPTDVLIQYRTNFIILVHPGDSIHVEFDGKQSDRLNILKSIKFGGDASIVNQEAAIFQKMYYASSQYSDRNAMRYAVENYDIDQYIKYLDTLKTNSRTLYNQFLKDVAPNNETKIWALTTLDQDYYDQLAFYPTDHRKAKNLSINDWDVPISYYNPLLTRLPISKSMLISGYTLMNFINRFRFRYVRPNFMNEENNLKYKVGEGFGGDPKVLDSLEIYGIIKYTPDTLLRQLILAEMICKRFDKGDVVLFEKYRTLFDAYILEPFLREPLKTLYHQKKESIENPQLTTKMILNKLNSLSINQLMDTILTENKNKVIYIDCWATWCGPCIAEFPNSMKLMKNMKGKDVAFVYICFDSSEKLWKSKLSELQLDGQHFFLSESQSSDFKMLFSVNGFPHYFLIDRSGTFIEDGSSLRPNVVEDKIEALLNKK